MISLESAHFIAEHVPGNVRELEGALNKVIATAKFKGAPVALDLVKEALRDLTGKKRKRGIIRPRLIAMTLSTVFGTALLWRAPILPEMSTVWHTQVGLILLGHVVSVYLAHQQALRSFGSGCGVESGAYAGVDGAVYDGGIVGIGAADSWVMGLLAGLWHAMLGRSGCAVVSAWSAVSVFSSD